MCNTTRDCWVSIFTNELKEGGSKWAAKPVVSRVKIGALLVVVPCSWAVLAAAPQNGQGQIFLQQFSSGQTYNNERCIAHSFEVPWTLRVAFRAALSPGLATNIQQCWPNLLSCVATSSHTSFSFCWQGARAEWALQDHTLLLKSVFLIEG